MAGADPEADQRRLRRSSLLAALGDGLTAVALPLFVAGLTLDPLSVAGAVAFQHLPWIVVAAFGSRFVGGVDRRTTMGAVDTLRAVVLAAVGYLVLTDAERLGHLYLAAFVIGLGEIVRDDGEEVGGGALTRGEGASSTGTLSTRAMVALGIALPVGGVLYDLLAAVPLLVGLALYSFAALATLSVRHRLVPREPGPPGTGPRGRRKVGGTDPGTVVPTVVAAIATLASSAVLGVLVLLAVDVLRLGAPMFGLLLAALAAAAVGGGLVAPDIGGRLGTRIGLVAALAVAGAAQIAAGLTAGPEQPYLAAAALVVASAASMAASVLVRAVLHGSATRAPERPSLHVFHLAVWAAIPLGALIGGLLGRMVDVPAAVLGAGVLSIVAGAVSVLVKPAATSEPPEPQPVRMLGERPVARTR